MVFICKAHKSTDKLLTLAAEGLQQCIRELATEIKAKRFCKRKFDPISYTTTVTLVQYKNTLIVPRYNQQYDHSTHERERERGITIEHITPPTSRISPSQSKKSSSVSRVMCSIYSYKKWCTGIQLDWHINPSAQSRIHNADKEVCSRAI